MKLELEQIIIGTVVLTNRYGTVGHILSPGNFSITKTVNYALIWQAIGEMYERLEPLDFITLTHHIKKYYGKDYATALTACANRVGSDANLKYHAIVLVELDFKRRFATLLTTQITELQDVSEARASAMSILKRLNNPDEDVFMVLEGAVIFLRSIFYPEKQYNQLLDLRDKVPEKIAKIKQLRHVDELFNKISRIPDLNLSSKEGIALEQVVKLVHNLVWEQTTEIDTVINKLIEVNEIYG